jgi:hypothetical protein
MFKSLISHFGEENNLHKTHQIETTYVNRSFLLYLFSKQNIQQKKEKLSSFCPCIITIINRGMFFNLISNTINICIIR